MLAGHWGCSSPYISTHIECVLSCFLWYCFGHLLRLLHTVMPHTVVRTWSSNKNRYVQHRKPNIAENYWPSGNANGLSTMNSLAPLRSNRPAPTWAGAH